MRTTPPLHVYTLDPKRLGDHLHSASPYNACVVTLTVTAHLGGDLTELDAHVREFDGTPHFCEFFMYKNFTGSF